MKRSKLKPASALVLTLQLVCSVAGAEEVRGDRDWIGRPWEFSYVILGARNMASREELGKKTLATGDPKVAQMPEAIFPYTTVRGPEDPNEMPWDRDISTLLITFDKNGLVTSPYAWNPGLTGHISRLMNVSLASGSGSTDLIFKLGAWYIGTSSDELKYIPAICSYDDMRYRYKRGFKPDSVDGGFGCREWGYYLKSDEHPYIDVTTYYKDGSTYIRPFVGWGRFDTPPKPVIGKQGKAWMCLHDCPDGAAPGVIPDIAAWARQRGWQVPKRPKKMPLFTDVPRKPGELMD